MLFDVEADLGHRIVGYLVPDSFSVECTIRVVSGGQEIALLDANEARPSVVAAGRHGTGQCGFVLTDDNVPNLSNMSCLEVEDAETGLVIYRRRPADSVLQARLFRLETHSIRSRGLDHAIADLFQLPFTDIDRYGRETTTQTFLVRSCGSLYISARVLYKEYEYSIDDGFRKACMVQDPHVELAETILALSHPSEDMELNFREQLALETTTDYLKSFNAADQHELSRGLSRMPAAVETALSNPLARSLAARANDNTPNATYVAASLESLASFDIVGLRERPESFFDPLAELLGVERSILPYIPPAPNVLALAEVLRTVPAASALIDLDLEIFAAVRDAVEKSLTY